MHPAAAAATTTAARSAIALATTLATVAVLTAGCIAPRRTTPLPVPVAAARPAAVADSQQRHPAVAARGDSARLKADTVPVAAPEVARVAEKIFGDSVVARPADSAVTPEPTWDIDVRSYETRERVQFWVNRFTHEARGIFTRWLERGRKYDGLIRPRLRNAGLPEDLTYLALIESGYDTHAYSTAAAVGMWQLMSSTARDEGIRVDWWVDERRDPERSTDAAVKFLRWLKKEFGSLYLAAAAYDGGPGRIGRGLTRYADDFVGAPREDAFFIMAEKDYLRAETKEYVPKLIAAALVAKEPGRYGLTPNYAAPFQFDTARVAPNTPLAAIAKATGIALADVRDLNPAVLRGLTPPRDSFLVRVPVGKGAMLGESLAALPESDRKALTHAATRKGDTMESLAKRAGVSGKQLGWYNRSLSRTTKGRLVPGQDVMIPSAAVVAAALDVPDPSIEKWGSSSRTRSVTHVVKRGETLAALAKRFGTTSATLKRLNGLKGNAIAPGDKLVVKRTKISPRKSSAKKKRTARSSKKSAPPAKKKKGR
ncbi:MAG: transglycosylase SLT domain-containing protein [Gemmatimonadaceae bacterium]